MWYEKINLHVLVLLYWNSYVHKTNIALSKMSFCHHVHVFKFDAMLYWWIFTTRWEKWIFANTRNCESAIAIVLVKLCYKENFITCNKSLEHNGHSVVNVGTVNWE
jgi:hypothetical protein